MTFASKDWTCPGFGNGRGLARLAYASELTGSTCKASNDIFLYSSRFSRSLSSGRLALTSLRADVSSVGRAQHGNGVKENASRQ